MSSVCARLRPILVAALLLAGALVAWIVTFERSTTTSRRTIQRPLSLCERRQNLSGAIPKAFSSGRLTR
jgi:hypothetical protein